MTIGSSLKGAIVACPRNPAKRDAAGRARLRRLRDKAVTAGRPAFSIENDPELPSIPIAMQSVSHP